MVDNIVVAAPPNIPAVMRVVGSGRSTMEKTCDGCVISSGVLLGTAVGSAVTMLVRSLASLAGVSATGVTVGASRVSVAGSKHKSKHDDLSDAAGTYSAGGSTGISSTGTSVIEVVLVGANGSSHGGGAE